MVTSVSLLSKDESDALPLDFESCVNLLGGDRAMVLNLINEFSEYLGAQVELIAEALADANHEKVSRVAHSIKGGAAVLSANPVLSVATVLEDIGKSGDLSQGGEVLLVLAREATILRNYCSDLTNGAD